MEQKIVAIITKECRIPTNGRQSDALNDVRHALTSEIRLLEHKGELNGFNAYTAVTRLITRYSGIFTTDMYEMADNAHRLAFLGKLLRMVEEPFALTYRP